MQSYLNMSRMSRHIYGSLKLQCGARITLQSNYIFFWFIDLMECEKKTVNQFPKCNTFVTHRLQTIELCFTWIQTQSLLTLPKIFQRRQLHRWHLFGCWNDTAHAMRRWKSETELISIEYHQSDSWWFHPCSANTNTHACPSIKTSRLPLGLVLCRASAFPVAFPEQISMSLSRVSPTTTRAASPMPSWSVNMFYLTKVSENCYPWIFSQDVRRCLEHSQIHG